MRCSIPASRSEPGRDERDRAGTQRDAPGSARGHPHAARRPGTPRHRRPRARLCRGDRCRCADRGLRSADRSVSPNQLDISYAFVGAQGNHLLGFDGQGRDLFSRLLVGARSSLLGPLLISTLAVVTGALLAIAAAWIGGSFDATLAMVFDVMFAFPAILLAVVAAAVFGPGLTSAMCALSIAYLPYVARVLRGAGLRERSQPYVEALEVQGLSAIRICLRHLLPNVGSLVVAQGTILFGWAMVDLAAISFLGLGVQAPGRLGRHARRRQGRRARGLYPRGGLRGGLHRRGGDRRQPARRASTRTSARWELTTHRRRAICWSWMA